MASASAPPSKHHVLAVPLPAQGHINPMIRFCRKLAREGVSVTFVHVDLVHNMLQQLRPDQAQQQQQQEEEECREEPLLRTTHVPVEGLDLSRGFAVSSEEFFDALKSIEPHLRHLLARLRPPVTCILSDVCITSVTQPVADSMNLPRIAFYSSSPTFLLFASYLVQQPPPYLCSNDIVEAVAKGSKSKLDVFASGLEGLPSPIRNEDLPHFEHVTDDTRYMLDFFNHETMETFQKAHSIVVNSFHELEEPAFHTLSTRVKPPIYGIGPLVEPLTDANNTSLWKEEDTCMLWLDQQTPLSVLYVSFGSITLLSHSQFQEILDGILSSGHNFLWVLRPGLVLNSPFPIDLKDLMSKAQGRGYFVGWAPQVQVLSHPSIGGFLTHCGWNSTIEAISLGVPMLCWPYFADQMFNAKCVTEVWRIGFKFTSDKSSGLVMKDEIESITRALMQGEKGQVLRENAIKLREAARNTLLQGSESHNHVQALLSSLLLASTQKHALLL